MSDFSDSAAKRSYSIAQKASRPEDQVIFHSAVFRGGMTHPRAEAPHPPDNNITN